MRGWPRHPRGWALLLVGIALVIRLGAAVAAFHKPLTFDAMDYVRIAQSIASGHGYPDAFDLRGPTAFRPPGFPYFLAVVYEIHASWNAGRIAEAIVGTAVVALIGAVTYQLLGTATALVALAIAAVYPPLVVIGTSLLSEPLFILFELSALAAALRSRSEGAHLRSWAAVAGGLSGMACLTRSSGAAVVAGVFLVIWVQRPRLSRHALVAPVLAVVCGLVVVAPWTLRNALVMHAFVPVSDQSGYTLAGTYNTTSARYRSYPAGWLPSQDDLHNAVLMRSARSELEEDKTLKRAAEQYMEHHPAYVLKVGLYSTVRLLTLDRILGVDPHTVSKIDYEQEEFVGKWVANLAILGFAVVSILAIVAIARGALVEVPLAVWSMPMFLATVVFIEAGNRFRLPIDPFLIVMAAAAVVYLAGCLRFPRSSRRRGSATTI